jgi:glycosyltransferase involved in cell wall biosynthesis
LKSKTDLLIENFNAIPFFIPIYNQRNLTIIHHLQIEEWKKMFGNFLGTAISKVMNRILLILYKKQKIITVSKSSKKEILNFGFKPKELNIVYNGIDIPIRKDISKPKDTINICYMGRVVKPKNIDRAIKLIDYAIKELKITNIKMEVGGGGPEVENLRNLVNDLDLINHVKVLGRISDEEKVKLFERSHLFLMLSHKEGWGITIIEAASQATPSLGYNVQGINDSLHPDTGYLVELGDNLKEKFEDILTQIQTDSKEYQSKKEKCLQWAQRFEWGEQREKFWKIVQKELEL